MCTFDTDKIYLTWRKNNESKRWIIGTLEKDNADNYSFYYLEDAKKAKEDGFMYYPSLVDLDKTYKEQILNVFSRRLLNPARKDYSDFLSYWGAEKYEQDNFALLGLTGAKLLTDNFEFIAPHPEIPASFLTDISWIQLAKQEVIEKIRTLDFQEIEHHLTLSQDKNNSYDKKAIILTFNGQQVGFIKSIHCENIYNALENKKSVKFKVKNIIRNGSVKEILLKIEIDN